MAENTNFVIHYTAEFEQFKRTVADIEARNLALARTIASDLSKGLSLVDKQLIGISQRTVTVGVGDKTRKELETITKFSGTITDAQGKSRELIQTFSNLDGQTKLVGSTFRDSTVKTISFADNVKRLAERAALTIPLWLALRAAITGVFTGIRDGLKNIVAFDLALQKIRNNLQGTPEEIAASFKTIKDTITETSKATGISTEELAGAVKEFATLGFDANESLQGALGASKLSIALFGDAKETAGAFARALNILIDRSKGAKSAVDQMNDAFALTSQLEEANNFEIAAATEALDKFAGTAAGVGLTLNQTLQILAAVGTAGRAGSEGATLLSTSFNQLLVNLPKISKSLGLTIRAGESTFDIFTKILDKITELNNTPGGQSAAVNAIGDIFGGAKGIKIVQSLVAVKETLDENVKTVPNFIKLLEKADRALNSSSGQAKLAGNNLKELGKSFVASLLGSDDFTEGLGKVNKVVTELTPAFKSLASAIGFLLTPILAVTEALAGLVTFNPTLLKESLNTTKGIFVDFANAIFGVTDLQRKTKKFEDTIIKSTDDIVKGVQGKLSNIEIGQLILDIKNKKAILPDALNPEQIISTLEKQLNAQLSGKAISPTIEVDPIISFKEQQDIVKDIIKFQLDLLKSQGASTLQIAEANDRWNEQRGIVQDSTTIIDNILNKEKAITEQKKLQLNVIGSTSKKLFEIAQTSGVDIAKRIGDVLQGNVDFSTFIRRGGEAVDVFKTQFKDVFEQQQAQAFFKGDTIPGLDGLRGGRGIAIDEEAIRGIQGSFSSGSEILKAKITEAINQLTPQAVPLDANTKAINTSTTAISNLSSDLQKFQDKINTAPNLINNTSLANQPLGSINQLTPNNQDFLRNALPTFGQNKELKILVTVDLNGEQNIAITTPEQLSNAIARQVSDSTKKEIIFQLNNNPQDPLVKALNNNTNSQ